MKRPRCRYGWLIAALAATTPLLPGCTGGTQPGGGSGQPGPASSSQTGSTTSASAAADAVLAAYQGFWTATAEASHTSNWQSVDLPRYARDAALQKITQALYADQQRGVVARGMPILRPTITRLEPSVEPTQAQVLDCGDDSAWVKVGADGTPVDTEQGGPRRITALLQLDATQWKVIDFAIQGVNTCA